MITALAISIANGSGIVENKQLMINDYKIFIYVTISFTKQRLRLLTAFAISIASGSGTVVKPPTHDQGL
jgi:hypothetical protein